MDQANTVTCKTPEKNSSGLKQDTPEKSNCGSNQHFVDSIKDATASRPMHMTGFPGPARGGQHASFRGRPQPNPGIRHSWQNNYQNSDNTSRPPDRAETDRSRPPNPLIKREADNSFWEQNPLNVDNEQIDSNSTSKDEKKFTQRCRLFVGNITPDTTEMQFKEMFKSYGETNEIFVNAQKGFGFIRLDYRANAEAAKAALDGTTLKGRTLRVRFAAQAAALKVKNLPPCVSNELLMEAFSQFGEIEKAVVIVDDRGRATSEGIVEYARKQSAQNAFKRISEGVFILTASPRPIDVEMLIQNDEDDGLPERFLPKNDTYRKEREAEPRFAPPGSFEYNFCQRWKQLFDMEKKKQEQLKLQLEEERLKIEGEMENAIMEQHEEMLKQDLIRQQEELRRLQEMRQQSEARRRQEIEMRVQGLRASAMTTGPMVDDRRLNRDDRPMPDYMRGGGDDMRMRSLGPPFRDNGPNPREGLIPQRDMMPNPRDGVPPPRDSLDKIPTSHHDNMPKSSRSENMSGIQPIPRIDLSSKSSQPLPPPPIPPSGMGERPPLGPSGDVKVSEIPKLMSANPVMMAPIPGLNPPRNLAPAPNMMNLRPAFEQPPMGLGRNFMGIGQGLQRPPIGENDKSIFSLGNRPVPAGRDRRPRPDRDGNDRRMGNREPHMDMKKMRHF